MNNVGIHIFQLIIFKELTSVEAELELGELEEAVDDRGHHDDLDGEFAAVVDLQGLGVSLHIGAVSQGEVEHDGAEQGCSQQYHSQVHACKNKNNYIDKIRLRLDEMW